MFPSMSSEHIHERFRFTFKRRFRRSEVHDHVIGSQMVPGYYMLTKDGGVTEGVPLRGRRVLIEPT